MSRRSRTSTPSVSSVAKSATDATVTALARDLVAAKQPEAGSPTAQTLAAAQPDESHAEVDETAIHLSGELTIADALPLHQRLLRLLGKGDEVRLDLSGVVYLDAAILQLLWAAQKSASASGARMTLQNVQQSVIDGAQILGMRPVLSAIGKVG